MELEGFAARYLNVSGHKALGDRQERTLFDNCPKLKYQIKIIKIVGETTEGRRITEKSVTSSNAFQKT